MAGGSIQEPGVEVVQEFVTTSPSIITPTLPTVIVGACIQVVDAFDDEGNPQAEALAGTYRDGQGVISYDLPGLTVGAVTTGLEDEVRVFLTYGAVVTELNAESDEVVIDSNTAGGFVLSTLAFTQVGALWTQIGVEPGDVVRLTYRGEVIDLEIDTVDTDSQLTLLSAGPIVDATLTGESFSVIRSPAQFVFSSGTQANFEIGTDANYLQVATQSTGDFAGSLGDELTYEISDSPHYTDGIDGASGDGIFSSAAATFASSVGAVGSYPTTKYLFMGTVFGALGVNTAALKLIRSVVSTGYLTIATGLGAALSAKTYRVGTSVANGTNGATDGAGTTFSSAGATFLASIPNTAGTPDQATFIEISGVGVYEITAIPLTTTLTLSPAATINLAGQTYRIITQTATNTDGATGALTDFVSAAGDFTLIPNTAGTPDQSTYISRGQGAGVNRAVSTITNSKRLVLGVAFASGFSQEPWQAVDAAADLTLTFDTVLKKVSIQLERILGVSSSTYADISGAINTLLDPSYNPIIGAMLVGSVVGSGTIVGTDVAYGASPLSGSFDGGSDSQDLLLDADLLGSATPTASVYVTYRALRTDVSEAAATPVLTEVTSTDDVRTKLGVISIENPLALACYFALLNAPSTPIKALGVSDISATKPEGTAEAFTSALEFLEGFDVYTVVVLTQDPTIHGILQTHVDTLSSPSNKSERIGLFNQAMPLYAQATVVASGVDGNTGATFDASALAEFSASVDFTAAGVLAGDILVVSANATISDSPDGVTGTAGPLYGIDILAVKPGDDFVLQLDGTQTGVSADWNSLIDVDFTVYRAGAAISQAVDQAEEIAKIGEGFADRRMFHIWPDQGTADIDGTEQIIDGFHIAAGWGGKISAVPPEQGMSKISLSGYTGLKHSNGYFSRTHLDRMAGGGTFITVQESQSSPLQCRHQLSTDVSTVQKREMSITKVVDYIAKFMRLALNKHTGKFNITQSYLDALTAIIQGLLRSLIESGRVSDAKLVELAVDETQPDRINIKVAVSVLYPANYIVVTLQV